jgi:hypothetical protein
MYLYHNVTTCNDQCTSSNISFRNPYKNVNHHIVLGALEFYETVSILMTCKLEVWLNVIVSNAK